MLLQKQCQPIVMSFGRRQNLHWKLGQQTPSIGTLLAKISTQSETTDRKNGKNCLNELNEWKFCEISWNSFSNRCWKFQLSTLKNKKVLFLKKFLSRCQYQNKKTLFTDPIFSEGFGSSLETVHRSGFLTCRITNLIQHI